jgi:hypothetical protein
MTIKIKQDEKLKKQKKIKKTTKKKSSGSIKRDINLAIPYRNSINIVSRKKK